LNGPLFLLGGLVICSSAYAGFAQSVINTQLPASSRLPKGPVGGGSNPIATHRFWAAKNWFPTNLTASGAPYTMFPEPLVLQSTSSGLLVGYSPNIIVQPNYFLHPWQPDFTLGVAGLNASNISASKFTDWTVDLDFGPIITRVGRGMPFIYATTDGTDPVLTFVSPPTVFTEQDNVLGVSVGGNSYGLFCPTGGRWTRGANALTCHLPPGKHYFSAALLPEPGALTNYSGYAFSFPELTRVRWSYDQRRSRVETTYEVTTSAKEGTEKGFLQALYAHQYGSLTQAVTSSGYSYASARGRMKVFYGRSFTTVDIYHGILPFLPSSEDSSEQRRLRVLVGEVRAERNFFRAKDTYATGKSLLRLAQLLPVAEMTGDQATVSQLESSIESEFARWLHPGPHREPPAFVYDREWGTLIGYPAAYGSDDQLNDHHFHYGYWIHAAALLGLSDPAWLRAASGGGAVLELARDIATPTHEDPMFPFLRHFDVFAGHSWASGQAPFGDGENEESSSEAVNAWAGLILFATEMGDTKLRDAAIWMYTLETNAAFDYWFNDGPVPTFPSDFKRVQVANVFDGKADAATWFSSAPALEHGIEFLPFTGASLYLGRDRDYARRNLAEVMQSNHGHIDTQSADWPDLMEMYEAFYDPALALSEWNGTKFVFEGETRAHEYAWLTSLQKLGSVDQSVTADTPFFAVFRSISGALKHVAFNATLASIDVRFSDGAVVHVPPLRASVDGVTVRAGN
jgi:hypothetical protein